MEILKALYQNELNEIEANNISIARGVRQGRILSSTLLNVYSHIILRKEGIRTGSEIIKYNRFADDTVIKAESMEELQTLLDAVNSECI